MTHRAHLVRTRCFMPMLFICRSHIKKVGAVIGNMTTPNLTQIYEKTYVLIQCFTALSRFKYTLLFCIIKTNNTIIYLF